jgi:hypothetical protein
MKSWRMMGVMTMLAALPAADSAFDLVLRPGVLPAGINFRLDSQFSAPGATEIPGPLPGSPGSYGDHDVRLSTRSRLWGSASSAIFVTAGFGRRWLDGGVWRPSLAGPLPEQLDDVAAGLGGEWLLGRWQLVGQVGVRSRSDEVFADLDTFDIQAETYATWQGDGDHGVLLGLSWGFRDRLLAGGPLPVAAWLWRPAAGHQLIIGLPVLGYRGDLADGWSTNVLLLPFRQDLQLSYRPWYAASDWRFGLRGTLLLGGEAWRSDLSTQADNDDELRYRDRRAGLRLSWGGPFWEAVALEGGWAFQRSLEEGPGRTLFGGDDNDQDPARLEPADGIYGRAMIGWRF